MPRSYELDSLKSAKQDAFERKQRAWETYADLRERCSHAHDEMESAWRERVAAREEMNSEFESMQQAREQSAQVWDEYGRIRDNNNYEIERLRAEANSEHQQMIGCFERASECYQFGDKAEAPYWSQQGHDHKERRDELNEEVRRLCEEVKVAKQDAMWRAPKVDASAFHRAKAIFESAKARHEAAQSEFKCLKAKRDQAKAKFDFAQGEFKRAKEAFQKKLEEVKANNQRERDRILDKAGVHYSERKDAKIVKKPDGTTQIYHGGVGSGDGYGHGHTTLDQFGRKTYDRGAFEEHGGQNFTEDGKNTCKTLAVGTDLFDGKPAKVRRRRDGKTDVFFVDSGNYGDVLVMAMLCWIRMMARFIIAIDGKIKDRDSISLIILKTPIRRFDLSIF